jgi:DUF1680 family protein
MPKDLTRRELIAAAAAVAAATVSRPLWAALPAGSPADPTAARLRVQPFDLSRVRLRPGPFLDAMEVNRRFLLGLDPDRLLHTFRLTSGLPTAASPLGGWESPANELRGHFTGHYLSACALLSASLGAEAGDGAKTRGHLMVAELAKCQKALGSGYLSAFPEELFDRLRDGKPAWAPWYTLHKIMAGLLDQYTHAGNAQALEVLQGMAAWAGRWVRPLGDAAMARVLEREYGGMNELLYNLAAVTGDSGYSELAHHFDHERIFAPLAASRDELKGLHVNTTIPKILGTARRYELTGEPRSRQIAEFFWRQVTGQRTYCTGGTSNGESWNADPGVLSTELSGYTQECCVTYNLLKLTQHVFTWTADPAAADYAERALWNGILGTQHPADGSKLYYVPLESGYWKLFGAPLNDFWCCTGSGSESFARLGESLYFHDDGLYVNQYVASQLDWKEKGVRLLQDTRFPQEDTVRLTLRVERPVAFPLRLRVPNWATRGGAVRLNGRLLDGFAAPGGYFVLDRTWRDGDRLELAFPMSLHVQPMPDDESLQAVLYGPLVLAGRLGTAGLTPATLRAEPTAPRTVPEYKAEPVPAPTLRTRSADPATWIHPVPGKALAWRTVSQASPTLQTPQAQEVELVPLAMLYDERYAVYWRVARTE